MFVHLKMKNKHVHITGKDIHCICKSTMKTGWFQFDLRSPEIFPELQNILEHQAYYRPLTLEMSLKIHVNTLL